MELDAAIALLRRTRPPDDADPLALTGAVTAIQQLDSWLSAQRIRCTQLLARFDALAEHTATEAARGNQRDSHRLRDRTRAVSAAPEFAAALEGGAINTEHVDELAASLRRLGDRRAPDLLDDTARLLGVAREATPDEFRKALRRTERELERRDGIDVVARQLGGVRLRQRIDRDDGMHQFTLRLDPLAGVKLDQAVSAMTEALFHGQHPPHCPTDPLERHSFLRAHALLAMLRGEGPRAGRPEVIVVVDTRSGAVDWGVPHADVPPELLRTVTERATIRTVTVCSDAHGAGVTVLDAPGELDLGRSTRLANAAQRRVLRALYPTCAMPACATPFGHCTVHHVVWWRRGGNTDLANLVPLCSRHHTVVHHAGWELALSAARELTVTRPDGRRQTTGPPARAP